jgi:hypothetical protein
MKRMLGFRFLNTPLFDERDAMAVRCFRGGKRVVLGKHVRVLGHICFSRKKKKFGASGFAPESELGLLEWNAMNCAQCNVSLFQVQSK